MELHFILLYYITQKGYIVLENIYDLTSKLSNINPIYEKELFSC